MHDYILDENKSRKRINVYGHIEVIFHISGSSCRHNHTIKLNGNIWLRIALSINILNHRTTKDIVSNFVAVHV